MVSVRVAVVAVGVALISTTSARAQNLAPEERVFLDQHMSDVVKVEASRLSDPALPIVFSVPIYAVKVAIHAGNGVSSQQAMVIRQDSQLVGVALPSSDDDAPQIRKMMNPRFRLLTDQDAIVLEHALDVVYPIVGSEDRKAEAFRHDTSQWMFVRGLFFGKQSGFVFKTDATGAITSVKYALRML